VWDRDLIADTHIWEEQMYRLRGLDPTDPRLPSEIEPGSVPKSLNHGLGV
jgi:hypothetical protein